KKFCSGHVIELLRCRENTRSTQSRHHELSVWGIGEELSEKEWRTAIRQLLARGIVEAAGDYGVLIPGPQAGPVLRGERTVELAVGRAPQRSSPSGGRRAAGASRAAESLEPAQRERFEALRAWRTAVAKEKQIPPYMVFSDATLVGIVEARPASVAQLGAVSGVGAKKLAEYGEAVLEALPDAPTG